MHNMAIGTGGPWMLSPVRRRSPPRAHAMKGGRATASAHARPHTHRVIDVLARAQTLARVTHATVFAYGRRHLRVDIVACMHTLAGEAPRDIIYAHPLYDRARQQVHPSANVHAQ